MQTLRHAFHALCRSDGDQQPTPWPPAGTVFIVNYTVLKATADCINPRRRMIATCDLAAVPDRPLAMHAVVQLVHLEPIYPPPPAPDVPDELYYRQLDVVAVYGTVVGVQFIERSTVRVTVRNDLVNSEIAYAYLSVPYQEGSTVAVDFRTALARMLSSPTLPRTRDLELIAMHRIGGPLRTASPEQPHAPPPSLMQPRAETPPDDVLPHPRFPSV